MLSSDIERANCYNIRNRISIQAFEKWHNVSYRQLNSTVKTRRVYTEYNVCYQVFLENVKTDFKSKI